MSNPTKWTHLGFCPQQWGSHYYIILKLFIIDGLYSVIWYVDIMQQLCIPNTLIYNIYPSVITKVNVSATVGMSATVGEISATVGEFPQQWGKCLHQGGKCALRHLRLEIIIHNSATITSEDTLNNMSKAH